MRYSEEEKRVVYEPVSLAQDFRSFDFLSPWEGAEYVIPGDEKAQPEAPGAPTPLKAAEIVKDVRTEDAGSAAHAEDHREQGPDRGRGAGQQRGGEDQRWQAPHPQGGAPQAEGR